MTDVKFKYNQSEIFAVIELYERTVCQDKPQGAEERLIAALLLNVYKRLRKITIDIKDKYTFKYKPEEALAFILYFSDVSARGVYEHRLIQMTIEQTDRKLL